MSTFPTKLFPKILYIIIDISERKKVTSLISMGTMWFRERDFRHVSVLLLWRDFVFFVISSAITG
jgi:hypothetical protein